jgi:hypothetical protein
MLLPVLTLLVACLFIVRLVQVSLRLARVGRMRSWGSALRVATSNVLVNAYLCYFAILLGYEVSVGGYIPVQGRYWLPFVSAVWLIAVVLAPRALPARYGRPFGTIVLASILGFNVLASAYTFPSIHDRFYTPAPAVAPDREVLADVSSAVADGVVNVRGMAVDLRDASPVDRIVVRLDDRLDFPAQSTARPDVLCDMEQTLLRTGFETSVPASRLRAGRHDVAVLVQTPWSPRLIDTGARASFQVR